ncbi:hypothetical protein PoB_005169100 [Plakobranchus ocellatus]|uniref:Uncharacterized protein n=1 Tax=Plakobranchus ocellatus TaxID=259542 RepID=A0AAV4C1F3_9GAST|nr:hypothetical protein PoB_005169100 [Plakobranchus ocellatus]
MVPCELEGLRRPRTTPDESGMTSSTVYHETAPVVVHALALVISAVNEGSELMDKPYNREELLPGHAVLHLGPRKGEAAISDDYFVSVPDLKQLRPHGEVGCICIKDERISGGRDSQDRGGFLHGVKGM